MSHARSARSAGSVRVLAVAVVLTGLLLATFGALGANAGWAGADEPMGWTVTEYVQPVRGGQPTDVVVGHDGAVWATLRGADAISRMEPATAAIETFDVPTVGAEPLQLVVGPDGAIWFTELTGAQIGRLDPASGTITEYEVTGVGAAPTGIAVGPDDAIWFTDSGLGRIGRLDPATGTITYETLPNADSKPTDIVSGPDGALWFTLFDIGSLGRLTTGGAYSEVLVEVGGQPFGLTVTTEGLLVTNLLASGAVAFVTTEGDVTQHAMPEAGMFAENVGADDAGGIWIVARAIENSWVVRMSADGATIVHPLVADMDLTSVVAAPPNDRGELAWFTESDPDRVAVLSSDTSAITSFDLPAGTGPLALVVDEVGHVWFTSNDHNLIGRLDPITREVATYPVPTPGSDPEGIVVGPDGAIWFTEQVGNKVGRLDPSTGHVTEVDVPTVDSRPLGVIVGPDGAIWFTEAAAGKLGRIDPSNMALTEMPLGPAGTTAERLTIGPDGAIWVVTVPPHTFPDVPPGDLTRVGPGGELTSHTLLVDGTQPQGITSSGGLLWWGSFNGAFVGSMTTSGSVKQWDAHHPTLGITAGPDGNVWYGGFSYLRLGSVSPEGQMIERVLPGHGTLFNVAAHGGAIWISDLGHDQLVRYQVQDDPTPPPPVTTPAETLVPSTGELPATGASRTTTPLVVLGAVLVAGGIVLAAASRRRFSHI